MAWYAYCITEQQTLANGTRSRRPSLLEGVQGVNGAAVLAYPSGEFNIVVSEYERDNVQFGEKNVLEHARVVSVCFRSGTVLPFRFGTIFDIGRGACGRPSDPIAAPSARAWPGCAARPKCT